MSKEQAYIQGFVKRAAQYGFNEAEAIELLKQSTVADAPAYQNYRPSISEGLRNVSGNLHNYIHGKLSPLNIPLTTGSAGSTAKGLGIFPQGARNVMSHLAPEGVMNATPKTINRNADNMVQGMASGLWNTPVDRKGGAVPPTVQ